MTGWHVAHLIALGLWGGIVLAESVVEIVGRREPGANVFAARAHFGIDVFCEIPVLAAVLVTGIVLVLRVPFSMWLAVKIGFGLAAVAVNAWCVGVVVRRHRAASRADRPAVVADTDRVFLAVKLGVPLALAALVMGLRLVDWR